MLLGCLERCGEEAVKYAGNGRGEVEEQWKVCYARWRQATRRKVSRE